MEEGAVRLPKILVLTCPCDRARTRGLTPRTLLLLEADRDRVRRRAFFFFFFLLAPSSAPRCFAEGSVAGSGAAARQ